MSALAAEHPRLSRIRKGLELVQVKVVDNTGALHLTFFNQGYVEKALRAGGEYIFFGTVEEQGRRRTMTNPIFERADRQSVTGCIMPVYRLTAGISNHLMAALTRRALECAGEEPETLPQPVRQAHGLAGLEFALRGIHFPADEEALALSRRRLTFEELFYLSVGLAFLKRRREQHGPGLAIPARPWAEFRALLPFEPTGAQRRVMEETAGDLYRILLTGETGEQGAGADAIREALADRFYALEVRDHTRIAQDVWARAGEDSLRGLFLRELRTKLQSAGTEEERQTVTRAARFGLAALDHRDLE